MEELKKGSNYLIEWVDGDQKTNCRFEKEDRGFLIFIDENNSIHMKGPVSDIKEINIKI
mgnify:CR=1 FL=1